MDHIRILLADDQALIRDGLKTILDLEPDFKVVGTAVDGPEAVRLSEALTPDIILLDIRMPGMNGVECVGIIKQKCPGSKVIMLTTFNDDEYIIDALASGACGYLLKDIEMDKLTEAIRDAYHHKMVIPPAVAAKLATGLSRMATKKQEAGNSPLKDLSEREMEIAGMLVQGFTNRQIASALYISEGTVRNYISTIYSKIGISDRTKAVLHLQELGLK
jgi:Response regulator containing a CheY-like receiver domain and an HTH DNA-binding domain